MATIVHCVTILALLLGTTVPLAADTQEKVVKALVVSVNAEFVVTTDLDGKNEMSHKIDGGTAVTIDDKPAPVTELRKGDVAQIALGQDGKVTRISVTRTKK